MARGKNKSDIIQVKSATTDTNTVVNLVDLSNETSNALKPEEIQKLTENITNDLVANDSLATNDETAENYVTIMKQIAPRKDDGMDRLEDDFIDVQMEGEAVNKNEVLNPDLLCVGKKNENVNNVEGKKKRKKDEKKKKKRNKKRNNDAGDTPVLEQTDATLHDKKPAKLEPVNRTKEYTHEGNLADDTSTRPILKPVGCFGFISTWIAKRKEKRREKKRKAIKARTNARVESLVEYEHKKAKGGVAFTVEIDSRPLNKSVLPPIKQKPGPIRLATEQRLEIADNKRTEQINKKREIARAQSRLVREATDRRVQNENKFKQATWQKIKDKEIKADRVTSRLEYARNQRCQSRMKSRLEELTSKWESIVATPVDKFHINSTLHSEDDPISFWEVDGDPHYNDV